MNGNDRGASAVEFALVLPLLVLLVFGIVDFSRAYNLQTTLSQAAREGVRTLALSEAANASFVTRTAVRDAAPLLTFEESEIQLNRQSCVDAPDGTTASVRVTKTAEMFYFVDVSLAGMGVMRCNG